MQRVVSGATLATPCRAPPSGCVARMEDGAAGMHSVSVSINSVFLNLLLFLTPMQYLLIFHSLKTMKGNGCLISILMIVFIFSIVKSCQDLQAPTNGTLQCSQHRPTIDTECTFACDPGFQLVGSHTRTCLPVAMWDGIPAYCKRKPSQCCVCNQYSNISLCSSIC